MEFLKCNQMMSIALKRSVNRAADPRMLERVQKISLKPEKIEFYLNEDDKEIKRCGQIEELEEIDSLKDFSNVNVLEIELIFEIKTSKYLRLMQELSQLPRVKKLTISCWGNEASEQIAQMEALTQCETMLSNLNELNIEECINEEILMPLVREMPAMRKLKIEGEISLSTLLKWNLHHLQKLNVYAIHGLESISQLTDHFSELEELTIGNQKNFFRGTHLLLGSVSPTLRYLDLTASQLKDTQSIAASKIHELCLRGCRLDPTPLKDCAALTALEMQSCILEKPMPDLIRLQELNYLVMKDCALKSLDFVSGLENLQILNVGENPIRLEEDKPDELPPQIAFVENMPHLMEIVLNPKQLDLIMDYPNYLSKKWRRVDSDMLVPNENN